MTHLYIIRHADYIYGLQDGLRRDLGLSPDGIQQAEKLRDRLVKTQELKPDVFIVSPERGAHETAKVLSEALGWEIVLDEGVQEWRSEDGSIETEEFMRQWKACPDDQKPFHRWIEGCENWMEFSARAHNALNRIVQTHAGKTIVVMSHGGIVQCSFDYFFGYGLATIIRAAVHAKNTSITHWFKPETSAKWILEGFNDHHHLKAVSSEQS